MIRISLLSKKVNEIVSGDLTLKSIVSYIKFLKKHGFNIRIRIRF